MRKIVFLFIFLLAFAQAVRAESIITVELNQSGDALWTMEKRIPLTIPEINEWEGIIKSGQNISRYSDIAEFSDMINLFLGSARNFSKRPMEVEKFNISYDTVRTMSGGFGIISYSFQWKNFSRVEPGKIFMGDAFPEGLVLSSDTVLVVKMPDGYAVDTASPRFDRREGNRLIWDGAMYHSFGNGEPSIILVHTADTTDAGTGDITWYIILISMVVAISGTSLFYWIKRQFRADKSGKNMEPDVPIIGSPVNDITSPLNTGGDAGLTIGVDMQQNDIPKGAEDIPEIPKSIESETALMPLDMTGIDLGDEEMIESFLIKSGGQAYQSDIVKELGVSKSKISIVIARMKENGRIIKIKKGKENIVRLVKK